MGSTAFKVRSCHVLFSCRCLRCLVWMGWEWIYIKLLGKLSHFLWICRIASSSSVIIFCAPSTCHRISTDLDSEWISPQQSGGWGNVVLHLSKCWLRICSIWIAKGDPERCSSKGARSYFRKHNLAAVRERKCPNARLYTDRRKTTIYYCPIDPHGILGLLFMLLLAWTIIHLNHFERCQ